ncbi:MAG: tRNA pseudouridine(55) synthase TruB [Woeseiaceae bacterium]|nr:tRNA pseudouridine(55) synthase TruB [Woeseiaceae bacterium]
MAAGRFKDGQPVNGGGSGGGDAAAGELRRVYDAGDAFLGVAESLGDGRIAPWRLIRRVERDRGRKARSGGPR